MGKELIAVGMGTASLGALVTWTVVVDLVVRVVGAKVGGGGKADDDGEAAADVVAGLVVD